ncbi:MAG TPA: hypothetical protein IAA30_04920 [Candidatus Treponema faecavium]|nr:hypothetical protein [Candidatus Treponema faecavium]
MKKVMGWIAAAALIASAAGAQETAYKTWNDGKTDYVPLGSKVSISADAIPEGAGTIVYSYNSGELTDYTAPVELTEEGTVSINYGTRNAWGEVSNMQLYTAVVDGTAPVVKYMLNGPVYADANGVTYVTQKTSVRVFGEDAGSGTEHVYVSVNGGEETDLVYTGVLPMGNVADGDVALSFYAVDRVGNTSAASSVSVVNDNVGPTAEITLSTEPLVINGVNYVNPTTEISVAATDDLSGVKDIYVSVNGADFARYQEVLLPAAGVDSCSVRAYAVDNLDNKGEIVELQFSTNLVLPVPTVVCGTDEAIQAAAAAPAEDTTVPADTAVTDEAAAEPAALSTTTEDTTADVVDAADEEVVVDEGL